MHARGCPRARMHAHVHARMTHASSELLVIASEQGMPLDATRRDGHLSRDACLFACSDEILQPGVPHSLRLQGILIGEWCLGCSCVLVEPQACSTSAPQPAGANAWRPAVLATWCMARGIWFAPATPCSVGRVVVLLQAAWSSCSASSSHTCWVRSHGPCVHACSMPQFASPDRPPCHA